MKFFLRSFQALLTAMDFASIRRAKFQLASRRDAQTRNLPPLLLSAKPHGISQLCPGKDHNEEHKNDPRNERKESLNNVGEKMADHFLRSFQALLTAMDFASIRRAKNRLLNVKKFIL